MALPAIAAIIASALASGATTYGVNKLTQPKQKKPGAQAIGAGLDTLGQGVGQGIMNMGPQGSAVNQGQIMQMIQKALASKQQPVIQ